MATYKCFRCEKEIKSSEVEARPICPHCNSRIFYKPRVKIKTVKTD